MEIGGDSKAAKMFLISILFIYYYIYALSRLGLLRRRTLCRTMKVFGGFRGPVFP